MTQTSKNLLFDIEGTTSSIAFVHEVMFPFARRELADFVARHVDEASLANTWDLLAQDAGAGSLASMVQTAERPWNRESRIDTIVETARRLMDADAKATGLKDLQGKIWDAGFASGELKAHVYPDVPPAFHRWKALGKDLRVYSSGSIAAQKLFFSHTEAGNLLPFFSGHYDTTTGPKREAKSYQRLVSDWGVTPSSVMFFSDVVEELDAAEHAGLRTVLVVRPGNKPVLDPKGHWVVSSFEHFDVAPISVRP